jgi:hypothetical protein
MTVSPQVPNGRLGRALRRYVDARNAALIEARRALGVNDLDARALLFVADNPATRATNLRDYLGITSAGVTALIDRLVERGAVRRDMDAADRRVNRLTVTVDMSADPWSALSRFDHAFDQAAAGADMDDTQRFADALDRFTATAARP